MVAVVTIRDESTAGTRIDEFFIDLPQEAVSARELLRFRVNSDVAAVQSGTQRSGLIPLEFEGSSPGTGSAQFDRAVEAFESRGFIMIVDDHQVEDLDEVVRVTPGESVVLFLRLVPLAGG